MTCTVCAWSGPRRVREVNWNTLTQRWECSRCFHTLATAEAECIAQGQAAGW